LLRPGRFEKLIYVPPPDKKARYEILKVHTSNMPLSRDVDLQYIAAITEGYSGADLAALVREAALMALREDIKATEVKMKHFLMAKDRVTPSLSESMIKFYEDWLTKMRRRAPATTRRETYQI